ncbi:hypothetical protein FEZ61_05935 [Pseudomonas sp. MS15a(2019)]|nr:hypothetical protein [Pseudomonas sp. MS15a(2019)]
MHDSNRIIFVKWPSSMKIILMRHGKPALKSCPAMASSAMARWIADYDRSEIGTDTPTSEAIAAVRDIGLTATSTAPRALTSLAALGIAPTIRDSVFCEAALPVVSVPILRLSPFTWAFVFRLLWLCGLAKESESYAQAKGRAHQAADQLVALAGRTPGSVLLLGHGFMNRLIARQLQRGGWAATGNSGSGYWSVAVYEKAG